MTDTEKIAVAAYQKGFHDGFVVGSYATSIFIVVGLYGGLKIVDRLRKKKA